ncbi:hypothetical protein OG229_02205 [Streptomyces platensis]|uniref:hypothetical protein n=1 Tax=Streptomyces platensis TaxID=58346 RepID=UPI002E11C3FA|nr:hypothetical protein OG229_02205 [Streptomyces platensis]
MAIPGNLLSSTTEAVDPNTSGWTAKLNCTISLGSGGRNGDGCLTVRSVAAGEMQARTVSSYAVTPGVVYEAFADTSGTVAERIGIRWLTATGAEISVTWSLTTAAASAAWHRVSVAGAAPVGAARAQVLLSSTPAAGAVPHFWENVYLGYARHTTGNLLTANSETSEVDASGWGVETNATLGRTVPAITWAVDAYQVGGHMLTVTAVANGNVAILGTERPVVTPGIEYLAYTYLSPPTAAITTWIELRFYDAGGTQLSATRGSLAAPSTGYFRQRVSAVAPAGAASCAVAAGMDSATTGQVMRLDNTVVTVAPKARAGSITTYEASSLEQGVGGWSITSGAATVARSTPWGAYAVDGNYSLTISSATATTSTLRSARFPLTPGAGLNWRAEWASQVTAGGWTATRGVRWYDAANNSISLDATTSATVPTSGWWMLTTDVVAPANATQAAIEWTLTATSTSSVLRMDVASLWPALPLAVTAANPDTASVTLTLRELTVSYLLTVYRIGQDGARTLVRGPSGLFDKATIGSDLMVIEDYEAPLGVPVTYAVEIYTAAGVLSNTRSAGPVTIDAGDPNEAWLKDPGQPQRNLKVLVERAPDWSRPIQQSAYQVKGRRNAVVLSGLRGGLEGDLSVWTRDDDERAALHWLLDTGDVLLWQAAPGMGVADMYVNVGSVDEARVSGYAPELWRTWKLPLTQADMPTATGVGGSAGRTWQDVLSSFATGTDVLAAYETGEDLLLDQRRG